MHSIIASNLSRGILGRVRWHCVVWGHPQCKVPMFCVHNQGGRKVVWCHVSYCSRRYFGFIMVWFVIRFCPFWFQKTVADCCGFPTHSIIKPYGWSCPQFKRLGEERHVMGKPGNLSLVPGITRKGGRKEPSPQSWTLIATCTPAPTNTHHAHTP